MGERRAPKFFQVWRLQWVEDSTLEEWRKKGAAVKTPAELEDVINRAAARGFELGELQGRASLRKGIEEGRFEPIAPNQETEQ